MDQIREFFYWAASIAMILVGLAVIGFFVILLYIKRATDRAVLKLETMSNRVQDGMRTWRNLAFSRFVVRLLRFIF